MRRAGRGFTLIEVLSVVAIVAVLLSVMLPSVSGAREAARSAACMSNQRQLVVAWTQYANAWRDAAMPLADERHAGGPRYWWGGLVIPPATRPGDPMRLDPSRGFVMPFLDAALAERSVFECPAQPWGSYTAQPAALRPAQVTSTYGYNGYYLAPSSTPGWNRSIGHRPWQRLGDVERPADLFVFADTLLPGARVSNTALLDPPELFVTGSWERNRAPTTAFRHGGDRGPGSAVAARADGGVRAIMGRTAWLTHPSIRIGSAGIHNEIHYVPDARRWTLSR